MLKKIRGLIDWKAHFFLFWHLWSLSTQVNEIENIVADAEREIEKFKQARDSGALGWKGLSLSCSVGLRNILLGIRVLKALDASGSGCHWAHDGLKLISWFKVLKNSWNKLTTTIKLYIYNIYWHDSWFQVFHWPNADGHAFCWVQAT